jgi:hypothetical protein
MGFEIVSIIWAAVVIYVVHRVIEHREKLSVKPKPADSAKINGILTRLGALEIQSEEIKKLADEAKKLNSQTNLAMGFRPLSKKD